MFQLDLRENDDWVRMTLPTDIAALLSASEAVTLRPAPDGRWDVKAASWVGAAILGDSTTERVDLRVTPKVPIARLLFLLGYARSPKAWRDEPVDAPVASDAPSAIAEALGRLTEQALQRGELQGYRTVEESATTLRGRLREKEQLLRRFGRPLPVEVVYDEFDTDIAENQILKAALWRMLVTPGITGRARQRLLRSRHRLNEASDLAGGQRLPHWTPNRLNRHYEPALRLAEIILRSSSFELGRGNVPATGFLVSMPEVFEDFVTQALGDALTGHGTGRWMAQDSRWRLDDEGTVHLRPDLVWYPTRALRSSTPGVVVDAKYKAEKPAGFPNADIYQLLAYCSSLGLPDGHLVYAKGHEAARLYSIGRTGPNGAGVRVHAHTLDLDASPRRLLEQVDALAETMLDTYLHTMEETRGQPAAV